MGSLPQTRSRSKMSPQRDFASNAFFVETAPGLPSLFLANALAVQDGVQLSSPNWLMEVETQQGFQ